MKTKQEVIEHCKTNGYTKGAICKITGFLIGNGMKEVDEMILVKKGNLVFEDFIEWFNEEEENPLQTIMDDICANIENAKDGKLRKRYEAQLLFMMECFDISDE